MRKREVGRGLNGYARSVWRRGALLGLLTISSIAAGCRTSGDAPVATAPEGRRADRLREEARAMFTSARERVFPALVNIHVVTVNYWGGKEQKGAAVGSGTIISPAGHIVTNQHVTDNGVKFRCTLTDKREIPARMVGEDPLTDLAVLQLEMDALGADAELPVAHFGDSGELRVGDYVMAMGSPFSLSRSVTLGIVSNTERVFGTDEAEEMQLEYGQRTGLFTNWIQHDAAINPGNSGGPLVNLKGEIVGVNELGGAQMGFAIPSNLARSVVAQLIEHGEVPRSEIGVSFKPLQRTGIEEGVLVNSVVEDGPAHQAGIRAGDVITAIDGEELTVRFIEQVPPLMKRIAERPIGSQLAVTYQREGAGHGAVITTERLRKDKGDEAALRAWGVTAMEITDKMARDRRLDSTAGVLVSGVRSGGPAATAEPPLSWGGVIYGIDGKPVADLPACVELYREIMNREPLPEFLLVEFDDGTGKKNVTLLKPKPDEDPDPPREVRKAWIGIATQPVLTKLAEYLGHENRNGFRITRVYPRTNAAGTELRVGDIIVALNGEPLEPRGLQDVGLLARAVRRLEIGETARLTVLRGAEEREVDVPLEPTRLTQDEARRDQNRDFELTVRELTFFDRDENRWDENVDGVLVVSVEDAGWAGLGGVERDDLIQAVDGRPVTGLPSYRAIMDEIAERKPERVVFVVLRDVRTHFQFVEPDWEPEVVEGE